MRGGKESLSSDRAAGPNVASPTPTITRQKNSGQKPVANPVKPENRLHTASPAAIMFFRELRSARRPNGMPSSVKKMTNEVVPSRPSSKSLNDISFLMGAKRM